MRDLGLKILCLSNGHGEDAIALRILRELQQQPHPPELAVFPLVGEGQAFAQLENAPVIGPVQRMPSGGFIYMDSRELLRDVKGGLLQLTIAQFKAIRAWVRSHNDSQNQNVMILAVGDIVPLLFAWLSGAPYVFVGTAKSDYYLRDENGPLASQSGGISLEAWSGSVYLPWERWLMTRKRCLAVFPRDALTTETLEKFGIRAYNLGNPMMDQLEPENPVGFYGGGGGFGERSRSLVITLLPGSRAPEAYANWQLIIEAVAGILSTFGDRKLLFLGAISPELNLEALRSILEYFGWDQEGKILTQHREGSILRPPVSHPQEMQQESPNFQLPLTFVQRQATMILSQQNFNDYLYEADLAVAMAGTATEQFVGLGKPAIAIPGTGPQFTPAFAEAQSRLLGSSLILVNHPSEVASTIQQLLFREPDRLELIYENGKRRMGEPGAARRIANCLIDRFVNSL